MKYIIIVISLLLISCKKNEIEEIRVYSNAVHYNLTEGNGYYMKRYDDKIVKTQFKFNVSTNSIKNIKEKFFTNKFDTVKSVIDLDSKQKYSNIYGKRLLLIEVTLKNSEAKKVGYSGPVDSIPENEFIAHVYKTCNQIKDSLKLRPVDW